MAFIFDTDIFCPPGSGQVAPSYGTDVAIFHLKQLLKAAGWTVPSSSDGITYNPSGDQITSANSGAVAGGMGNDNAWFVVRSPDGHAWCFQRGVGADFSEMGYAISVSRAAGFIGGSPDAVTPPTADDQGILTDLINNFFGFQTPRRYNIGAENVAPYRFWASPLVNNVYENNNGLLVMDTLSACSGPGLDPDPFIYIARIFGGYSRANTPEQRFSRLDQVTNFNASGSNPLNGKDDYTPITYAFSSRGQGYKGNTSMLYATTNQRRPGTTLMKTTPGDLLIIGPDDSGNGAYVVPWNGTLPKRDI
jgi:phage-related tail fiber protein